MIHTADGAALLDIQQGVCFSLNQVGLRIWQLLNADTSVDEIATRLAAESNSSRSEAFQDVTNFVGALKDNRLIGESPPRRRTRWLVRQVRRSRSRSGNSHSAGMGARHLFFKAFFGLVVFDLTGLCKDFPSIHALVKDWVTAAPAPDSAKAAHLVCTALDQACAWYPKQVLCLQRSVILTCMLRDCGVHGELVIGAQKAPFEAHAWTEVENRAVNERKDVQAAYLVWERC